MNNTPSQHLVIHDKATSDECLKLDFLRLKKAAMILRALNHKLRQQLLKFIDENQKITVTEIYVNLGLSNLLFPSIWPFYAVQVLLLQKEKENLFIIHSIIIALKK